MITVLITALIICTFALKLSSDSERLSPSPAHTIANRWIGENGRSADLSKLKITDSTIYCLDFDAAPPIGTKLIIKSNNMGISAYTNGKMLFKTDAESGSKFNIIPIDELTDESRLYLHLTPLDKMTGSITDTVKITTQNDFIMSLLMDNAIIITAIILLALLFFSLFTFTAIKLSKAQKQYCKNLYLCAFVFMLIIILADRDNLLQFVIGSAVTRYVIKYTTVMLIPVPLTAYITALIKKRSTPLEVLQITITAYSVFRLILFSAFQIPLERGIAVSYLLMITETIWNAINIFRLLKNHQHLFAPKI